MAKDRFPHYKPEQVNSMVIIIKDKSVLDDKYNKQVVEVLKDMTDINNFFDKLQVFCKLHGLEIDSSGTREQMAARLYKKDGKNLITEEEALAFTNNCIPKDPDGIRTAVYYKEDLHEWRKEVDDMK